MSEEQKPNYQDKIPAKTWPWIVAMLIGAIVWLAKQNVTLSEKLVTATDEKVAIQRELTKAQADFAKTWRELYYQSAKIIAYTNPDSSRDFDHPASDTVKRTN